MAACACSSATQEAEVGELFEPMSLRPAWHHSQTLSPHLPLLRSQLNIQCAQLAGFSILSPLGEFPCWVLHPNALLGTSKLAV